MQNGFVAAANYQSEGRIPAVVTGSEKAIFILVFAMVGEGQNRVDQSLRIKLLLRSEMSACFNLST
jgi:hypothetical protein